MNIPVNAITSERPARSPRRKLMQGNSLAGTAGTKTRRPLLVAAASVAGLVLVGMLPSTGRAHDTTPSTATSIYACYTPSGSVYVVNPPTGQLGRSFPGAPDRCASPTHQLFHFDDNVGTGGGGSGATGPTGP